MEKELSLYLHFPFCKQKCKYCDFHSVAGCEDLIPAYIEAVKTELGQYLPQSRHLSSVYCGGGTPSLVPVELMVDLLQFIKSRFLISPKTEITMEVNPGTLEVDSLARLYQAGVNRLSIGLQATQDHLLEAAGRIHSWQEFIDVFHLARETGFTNIGVDLIFGLPGQTPDEWMDTLRKVVYDIHPEHISAYGLQLEKGTELERLVTTGQVSLPHEDEVVGMMHAAMEFLPSRGYEHYEVSNFARSGFRSIHNMGYWTERDYLGFGTGAHSKIYHERRWNIKDIRRYIQLLQAGETVVEKREAISGEIALTEALMLGLRLRSGISLKKFKARYGLDLLAKAGDEIDRLQKQNLVTINEGRLALTDSAIPISNYVIGNILTAV